VAVVKNSFYYKIPFNFTQCSAIEELKITQGMFGVGCFFELCLMYGAREKSSDIDGYIVMHKKVIRDALNLKNKKTEAILKSLFELKLIEFLPKNEEHNEFFEQKAQRYDLKAEFVLKLRIPMCYELLGKQSVTKYSIVEYSIA